SDGGTIFVQDAPAARSATAASTARSMWLENSATIPQVTISTEQYNRLVRMVKAGEKVKLAVNLQVQFHTEDLQAYNTIAEIPGTDLKDQIVMLGGHMDSWIAGTGATDNGAGVAVAMEVVRLIKTLGLQPRRTIRVALSTGEEEGIYGSAAYGAKHFASRDR